VHADDAPTVLERIRRLVRAIAREFFPESDLPQHLLLARISAPIKHQSAHRLGSMTRELVEQGQQNGEIRRDVDPDLVARLIMTGVFYHFMCVHPLPHRGDGSGGKGTPLPGRTRSQSADRENDLEYALDLEAKLIESVDTLMDGLGGPRWRQQ
jgi:hypothetical protein